MNTLDFLLKHVNNKAISFHMPGHKGPDIYRRFGYGEFLDKIMDCDITEIPGADNLFQAEGILKNTQDKYASLYEVKNSYLLINGTSGGIIAGILASVPKKGKLIMARNCHKSVFNALILGDIRPAYIYPELIGEYGISGEITVAEVESCIKENPDAKAVLLPSPNYYGICSDIKAIAELVHSYDKILIVDQAHGAHLKFFNKYKGSIKREMPLSAEEAGADIVINSIHKTLASFTQSAVLNFNSDRLDRYMLEDKLQAIQSTSPSYLLMASLDINASIMDKYGHQLMKEWNDNLDDFYNKACELLQYPRIIDNIKGLDISKINIESSGLGLTAAGLENKLMKKYIFPELTTGNILMLMTGIGNKKQDYDKLIEALDEISVQTKNRPKYKRNVESHTNIYRKANIYEIPRTLKRIKLDEAKGYICASSIIPYPPGIPIICPGERVEADLINYIKSLRASGEKVIGINDKGEIMVGIEDSVC